MVSAREDIEYTEMPWELEHENICGITEKMFAFAYKMNYTLQMCIQESVFYT